MREISKLSELLRCLTGSLAPRLNEIGNPERTVVKEKEKKRHRYQTQEIPGPGPKIIIEGLYFRLAKKIHVIGTQTAATKARQIDFKTGRYLNRTVA